MHYVIYFKYYYSNKYILEIDSISLNLNFFEQFLFWHKFSLRFYYSLDINKMTFCNFSVIIHYQNENFQKEKIV